MPVPRIKRVYDAAAEDDGLRILVDRLWPRGFARTPPARSLDEGDRSQRYAAQALPRATGTVGRIWCGLRQGDCGNPALDELRQLAREQGVTLLYAASDTEHNNARALADILRQNKAPARGRG